jgi:hypothetical protein
MGLLAVWLTCFACNYICSWLSLQAVHTYVKCGIISARLHWCCGCAWVMSQEDVVFAALSQNISCVPGACLRCCPSMLLLLLLAAVVACCRDGSQLRYTACLSSQVGCAMNCQVRFSCCWLSS